MKRFFATTCAVALLGLTTPLQAATPADTLVIVREISSISDWDPAVSQILDVQEINQDIYDRLVGFDRRSAEKLIPMLAESYEVSEDGSTITFRMREGVKFHSGNPVTAADAVFSLRRLLLLGREPSSSMRQLGYTPENIDANLTAPDEMTFVMTLPEKLAPSLVITMMSSASFSIVDSKLLMENEKDGDFGSAWLSDRASGGMSAGSGPFMIQTYRPQEMVMLSRFDDYWQFKPSMARVIFRHVPEAGTQRLLLEKGDADVAFNLTSNDAADLDKLDNVKVEYFPSRKILYFGFNVLNKPFDNPKVIQAMRYLIDYQGLADTIMKDIGTVHQTFIPSGWLGALEETPFHLDVAKAKELLAEAGYPDGFEFAFTAYNRKPEMDLATSFQATAAEAGITVNVVNAPVSQTIPLYREQKLEALQLSYSGGYADPHATTSKFAYNPGAVPGADKTKPWPSELTWRLGWYPEEMSVKTLAASKELDLEKRKAMYEELQREQWEQGPFIHMFQTTQALGLAENVDGYLYGSRGADVSFAAVTKE
ncbi:MAG: ABC transporter substrate-binding protein [Pseudooceanicola sp.]|nr:ABC transporter substrate-binding protein [Pseudooceanicola sp.]